MSTTQPDGKEDEDHREPWQEIARQITVEKDPVRLLELCKKLDEVMLLEERERVKRHLSQGA